MPRIMDDMDDDTLYVLDTPDRRKSNVVEKKNDTCVEGHSRNSDSHHQSFHQGQCNRVLNFKIPRKISTDTVEHSNKCINGLSSSSLLSHSHRTLKFRRAALDKPAQEKVVRSFQESNGHQFCPKETPRSLVPKDSKEERSLKSSGGPSNYRNGASRMHGYSSKGKEKTSEFCGVPVEAGVPQDDKMWSNSVSPCQTSVAVAYKAPTSASKSVHLAESPKRGPKRFVRNGLISPLNIAKGKMIVGQNSNVRDAEQNNDGSKAHCEPWAPIDISESSAEEKADRARNGKGVRSKLQMSNNVDTGAQSLYHGDIVVHTEDYDRLRDANEEVGNQRRTHSYMQNIGHPISSLRINSTVSLGGNQTSEQKETSSSLIKISEDGGAHHQNGISLPSLNGHGPSIPRGVSYSATESSRGAKRRREDHSLTRQQRTNPGLPIILSGEPSSSRVNGSGCSNRVNVDARNWQLEADERLARELQEQLYQEDNLFSGSEMDANIAMALFQDEQAEHSSAADTHPLLNPGASMAHRMPRQPRLRSSQPSSLRRGARPRLFGRSRGAQPRSSVRVSDPPNFLGSFPFEMSVDTRLDILEAWEAASDDITGLGILDTLFQAGHDFNENDYERLLALDENNHEQGASTHQINNLPLSTVQTDNFEDSCAICLETPGLGETVRHLPCLHKFHKECIDQWLGRKTWCPVCKSSIG